MVKSTRNRTLLERESKTFKSFQGKYNSKTCKKPINRQVKTRLQFLNKNIIPLKGTQEKTAKTTPVIITKSIKNTGKVIKSDQVKEYIVEEILNFDSNYKNTGVAYFEVKWKNYKKYLQ
jgi:hypothetical protein